MYPCSSLSLPHTVFSGLHAVHWKWDLQQFVSYEKFLKWSEESMSLFLWESVFLMRLRVWSWYWKWLLSFVVFFFFVPTCLPPPLRKWRIDVINPPPSPVGTRDVLRHVSFPFIVMCSKAWDCWEPRPGMKWQPLSVTRNRCVTGISVQLKCQD